MEVERLTAVLEATGLAGFRAVMDQADAAAAKVRGQFAGLETAQLQASRATSTLRGTTVSYIPQAAAAGRETQTLSNASRSAAQSHQRHSKELGNLTKEARGGIGAFTGLGRAMYYASNAFLGGVLIGGALKVIIDKTREAETAASQLEVTVKNTGASWAVYGGQIDATLTQQSRLSAFTKTDLTNTLNRLVLATGSVTKGQADLSVVTNLAHAAHEDLATATTQVTSAETGRLATIRGLGIVLPKVTTAENELKQKISAAKDAGVAFTTASLQQAQALAKQQDQAASAAGQIDVLRQKTEGANAAFLKTPAGKLQQFDTAVTTLEETLGQVLLPQLDQLLGRLTTWIQKIEADGSAHRDAKQAIDVFVGALKIAEGVIHDVDTITGGFKHTLELLAGLKVASVLVGWAGNFRTLAASIGLASAEGTAAGNATGLLGVLGKLKALGVIGITLDIATNFLPQNKNIPNPLAGIPGLGKAFGFGEWLASKAVGNPFPQPPSATTLTRGYQQVAKRAAADYHVPANLFLRQINQESEFNPKAVSSAGAIGIAQFMPGTAKSLGVDPRNVDESLAGAAMLMSQYYAKYKDWGLALAAYNAGSGAVDAYLAGKSGLPAETLAYVRSITGAPLDVKGGPGAGAGAAGAHAGTHGGKTPESLLKTKAAKTTSLSRVLPPFMQAQLSAAETGGETGSLNQLLDVAHRTLTYLEHEKVATRDIVTWKREEKTVTAVIETTERKIAQLRSQIPQGLASALANAKAQLAGLGGVTDLASLDSRVAALKTIATLQADELAYLVQQLAVLKQQGITGEKLKTIEQERTRTAAALTGTLAKLQGAASTQAVTSRQENILGISPNAIAGVSSIQTRERQVLLQELNRLMKPVGPHVTGAARTAWHLPPGVESANITQLLALIEQRGVTLPASTKDSLAKIHQVLALSLKEHVKLNTDVAQNLSERLTEINDTLKSLSAFPSNLRPVSAYALTAGLGLSPAARKVAQERYAQALAHHGMAPAGPTAFGIPVAAGHAPAVGPAVIHADSIVINVDARDVDPKVLAAKIRAELVKTTRRNGGARGGTGTLPLGIG